jgi:hypothetical protein
MSPFGSASNITVYSYGLGSNSPTTSSYVPVSSTASTTISNAFQPFPNPLLAGGVIASRTTNYQYSAISTDSTGLLLNKPVTEHKVFIATIDNNLALRKTRNSPNYAFNIKSNTENDLVLVNFYLLYDPYASIFMNNSLNIPCVDVLRVLYTGDSPATSGDSSQKYNTLGISVPEMTASGMFGASPSNIVSITTGVQTTPAETGVYYYPMSYNRVEFIRENGTQTAGTVKTTIQQIYATFLINLSNLYYNPGSTIYPGIIKDLQDKFPVNGTGSGTGSVPVSGLMEETDFKAGTNGLKLTPAAKHSIWLYIIARAQWINSLITENLV